MIVHSFGYYIAKEVVFMVGRTLDQFNSRQRAKAKNLQGKSKQDPVSTPDQINTHDKKKS
jgi:hypothetical protein